jgi:hypothetical protein
MFIWNDGTGALIAWADGEGFCGQSIAAVCEDGVNTMAPLVRARVDWLTWARRATPWYCVAFIVTFAVSGESASFTDPIGSSFGAAAEQAASREGAKRNEASEVDEVFMGYLRKRWTIAACCGSVHATRRSTLKTRLPWVSPIERSWDEEPRPLVVRHRPVPPAPCSALGSALLACVVAT